MKNNIKKERGFTIIETVISIAIFAIISIALFDLFNAIFKNIKNNKAILLANSIALEQIEVVRSMNFNDVITSTGWVTVGPILSENVVDKEGIRFTIKNDVSWVDDPFDGLDPTDTFPFDYKKFRIRIYWQNPVGGGQEEISMSTNVAPIGLGGISEGKGGIALAVFDSQGVPIHEAEVDITSDSLGYTLENLKTDVNGNPTIPETPARV